MPHPAQPVSRELFLHRDEPDPADHRDARAVAPVTSKEPDIEFYGLMCDKRFRLRTWGLLGDALNLLPLPARQQLAADLDLLRAEKKRRGEVTI